MGISSICDLGMRIADLQGINGDFELDILGDFSIWLDPILYFRHFSSF